MKKNLIVNLDKTLINSNIFHEIFLSACSKNWRVLFKFFIWFLCRKKNLKEKLNSYSDINVKCLPYNKGVLRYIRQHQKEGGFTTLLVESNKDVAKKIVEYLKLSNVIKISSSKKISLNKNPKENFLKNRYGFKKYDFMGSSLNDLPFWKNANKAISVGANSITARACNQINSNYHHIKLHSAKNTFFTFIKAMRAYHWIKNLIIFIPMLAAHQITTDNFISSFYAFIVFSLVASSVYIINDLLDLNTDRIHQYKKFRPIASGIISIKEAFIFFQILFFIGIIFSFLIGFSFLVLIIAYYTLTFLYSLILKKIIILDISILALFYTIRIFAGSITTQIEISFWLFVFSIFFFLSLAALKRQSELVDLKNKKKTNILRRGYNVKDLSMINIISFCSGFASILVAMFYINSTAAIVLNAKPWTLWFAYIILIFWLIRMFFSSINGKINVDPIIYAIYDNLSQLCFLIIMILFIINFI